MIDNVGMYRTGVRASASAADGRPVFRGDADGEPDAETRSRVSNNAKYLNAQTSLLRFNERVLEEARDTSHPLLEQVKFLAISHANLDEFFEIHVSGLQNQREGTQVGTAGLLPDGTTPSEALERVMQECGPLLRAQETCWDTLRESLASAGIRVVEYGALEPVQRAAVDAYFERDVFPVLTPLAVDPAHPFPHISHRSLSLMVALEDPQVGARFARVKVPNNLPRLVSVPVDAPQGPSAPPGKHRPVTFVWLEDIIAAHASALFPGVPVRASYPFRVTRDVDQDIREHDANTLMDSIRSSLRERAWGAVVRVEIDPAMPEVLRDRLLQELDAESAIADIRQLPLGRSSLMELAQVDRPDLKSAPFTPRVPAVLAPGENVFDAIKARDILLHHPYDAFAPVVQLIEAAADDPDVLAIKQTLYRVGRRSPIIAALVRARRKGKQVAVLVELKARGDEENNIEWAETLEREGVHVAHGIVGLKTHCKALLIVRREADGIRRYVHLATGNYNAGTARLYTDYGYLTARADFGEDMTNLFNSLTGYSRQDRYNRILVSPGGWRRHLVELIDREMSHHARGEPGLIRIKVNGLTDTRLTDLLYRASNAGVRVELMVRGMCCLRPAVPGMSENIRVVSLVGRFLEHSRVYHFRNGGEDEVYLGSADIMPRNLDRRIEAVFPIPDNAWRQDVLDMLDLSFADTARLRVLGPDGTYRRVRDLAPGALEIDAQEVLLAKARAGG
jgi:polyphosphate kinase